MALAAELVGINALTVLVLKSGLPFGAGALAVAAGGGLIFSTGALVAVAGDGLLFVAGAGALVAVAVAVAVWAAAGVPSKLPSTPAAPATFPPRLPPKPAAARPRVLAPMDARASLSIEGDGLPTVPFTMRNSGSGA